MLGVWGQIYVRGLGADMLGAGGRYVRGLGADMLGVWGQIC